MLKAGTILGERYEIVGRIGSGGMADVYKSKDHKLNRFVAVKVMKAEFKNDSTFISKFKREAQAAAGLANPNIVNVFDVGDDNGVYYIVMELVEGITLKEYIAKKGKLSVREATSIAIQVCMGLAAAHAQGIVHRDVKPQNIIISTDGKVKVTDFGIARAASSNTISANAMGSVHYSSPEQVRGGYSDAKSDIYSVGITLYEMVTGHVPFDGETTVEIAIKHLQDEMEPPSKYTPDLPYSLEQIIYKCTQKSVDRRYSSMNDVIADLKRSLIEPNGHFVQLAPLSDHAQTVMISPAEMAAIKSGAQEQKTASVRAQDASPAVYSSTDAAQKGYEKPVYDEDEDDDEEDDVPASRNSGSRSSAGRSQSNRNSGGKTSGSRRPVRDDDDDDDEGISGGLEKAMTIGGFIVGALIICILIYFIGRAAGIFKFGGSTDSAASSATVSTASVSTSSATTSTDPNVVTVPNIVGMTETQAQTAVTALGLGIKYQGEQASEDQAAGNIVSQDPAAGTQVQKNTTIYYYRSSGPAAIAIPDVTGKTLTEAQSALTAAGFTNITIAKASSDTVALNNVISIDPAAGTKADAATAITVTVSTGAATNEKVTVGSYTGLTQDVATEACTKLGLVVSIATGTSDVVGQGEVMAQSIDEGTEVTAGTEITLTINTPGAASSTASESASSASTTSTASTWSCDQRLGAPSNYTGGAYRLTLEQTVNGASTETTIVEGDTITFPYELKTTGAEGVATGKVHLYELVDGSYVIRANWEVPFSAS